MKIPELKNTNLDISGLDIDGKYFAFSSIDIHGNKNKYGQITSYDILSIFHDGTTQLINYIPKDVYPFLKDPKEVHESLTLNTDIGNNCVIEFRTASSGDMVIEYLGQHLLSKASITLRGSDGFIKLFRMRPMYKSSWSYRREREPMKICTVNISPDDKLVVSMVNAIQMLTDEVCTVSSTIRPYRRGIGIMQVGVLGKLSMIIGAISERLTKIDIPADRYDDILVNLALMIDRDRWSPAPPYDDMEM